MGTCWLVTPEGVKSTKSDVKLIKWSFTILACVQTSPLPQEKSGEETAWIAVVSRVPVYICINYFFVLSLTVVKAQVGRKIVLASVHRLAEHLHAISTQKSRYKISDYSQVRSSVPPKMPLMYLLFESWTGGSCRFQIHLCVHSCMRNEPWIHKWFSYEISTSSVALNLM